jgi:hypothetical protein
MFGKAVEHGRLIAHHYHIACARCKLEKCRPSGHRLESYISKMGILWRGYKHRQSNMLLIAQLEQGTTRIGPMNERNLCHRPKIDDHYALM